MTTVAAYISKEENRVYMASDSYATNASFKEHRKDPKIIRLPDDNPRALIGFCGCYTVFQELFRNVITPPSKSDFKSILDYVSLNFRTYLEDMVIDDMKDERYFSLLLAVDGKIFHISYDFSVAEIHGNYNAIGSGRDYAIGALYALEKNNFFSAKDKLTIAIEAASNNDIGTGGNINIEYV